MKALPSNVVEFMQSSLRYRHLISEPDDGVIVVHRLVSAARKSPQGKQPHLFYDGAWYAVQSRTFARPEEQPRKVNV